MTTVTEAAKRLGIDQHPLEQADIEALKNDAVLAQQFARRLLMDAKNLAPQAVWTMEELLAVMEAAVHGRVPLTDRVVEGRYLRKRVRELCAIAERFGDPFAMVVLKLGKEPRDGLYGSMAEPLVSKLRQGDMVTAYRRRLAVLLPSIEPTALQTVASRIRRVAEELAGPVVEMTAQTMFPTAELTETQAILDWLEDQLRLDM